MKVTLDMSEPSEISFFHTSLKTRADVDHFVFALTQIADVVWSSAATRHKPKPPEAKPPTQLDIKALREQSPGVRIVSDGPQKTS